MKDKIWIFALIWAGCSLIGLVFAGVAYQRAKDRLWDLEATQYRQELRIKHLENPDTIPAYQFRKPIKYIERTSR